LASITIDDDGAWPPYGIPLVSAPVINAPVAAPDDEAGVGLAFFALEDEPPFTALHFEPWLAALSLDDEISTNLFVTNFGKDEDQAVILLQSNPWLARPALDDEISVGLANFGYDDDPPWTAAYIAAPWVSFVANTDDESILRTSWDDESPYTVLTSSQPWLSIVFNTQPEEVARSVGIDDDAPYVPAMAVSWFAAVFNVEPEQIAEVAWDDETGWTAQVQAVPWAAVTFLDLESPKPFSAPDDEFTWTQSPVTTQPWLAAVFREDDLLGTNPFGLEDDPAAVPRVIAMPWLAVATTDDEAAPKWFGLEDETTAWVPAVTTATTFALAVLDDEQWSAPRFGLEDEAAYLPAVVATPWTARVATDDDAIISFFLEEFFPPANVVQPWGFTATPLPDDEQYGTSPFGLDEFQPWTLAVTVPQTNTGAAWPTLDDETLSLALLATGFTLLPATASGTQYDASSPFTVTPQGGALASAQTITLNDGGAGGEFYPPTLTFAQGTALGLTFTYVPQIFGLITLTAGTTLGTSPSAVYDSLAYLPVYRRLILAVKAVILNLGLQDLPTPGAGIPASQIVDQFVPQSAQVGKAGISIHLKGVRESYEPITFRYSTVAAPDVPLVGYLVTRPVLVDLYDATSVDWQDRNPAWLLLRERIGRAFLQYNVVEQIKTGIVGPLTVASVPELALIEFDPQTIIDEEPPDYPGFASHFRFDFVCSECGI
jgi:hypothetical protein